MNRRSQAAANTNALELRILDEGWGRPAWHGPNLRASLRGVTAAQANWRPARGRHNIRELVRHAAYWLYMARKRLGIAVERFPRRGSNWFPCADTQNPDEAGWRADLALLSEQQRLLREVIEKRSTPRRTPRVRSAEDRLTLLLGTACHEIYHAGQIQLLKRLQASR
jgi:hypothetical protein